MIKYAKITNQDTGLCEVGLGTNNQFYQSIGMIELDVQQSDIDNNWYTTDKCPMKSTEQKQAEKLSSINALTLDSTTFYKEVLRTSNNTKFSIQSLIQSSVFITDFQKENLFIDLQGNSLLTRGSYFVVTVGSLLNYTPEDLDYLFKNKVFPF